MKFDLQGHTLGAYNAQMPMDVSATALQVVRSLPVQFWWWMLRFLPWGKPLQIGPAKLYDMGDGRDWWRVFVGVTRPWGVDGVKLTLSSIVPLSDTGDRPRMLHDKRFAVANDGSAMTSIGPKHQIEFDVIAADHNPKALTLNFSIGTRLDPQPIPAARYRLTLEAQADGIEPTQRQYELDLIGGRVILAPSQERKPFQARPLHS